MSIGVKICGIMDELALQTAIDAGARFVGFVFYPLSKNAITAHDAKRLAALIPSHVKKTGLFVDPSDEELRQVTETVSLDLVQLHGKEPPLRVTEIKALTGLPVMKAVRLQVLEHLEAIFTYEKVADYLLFDSRLGAEPSGGPINWKLLNGRHFAIPWMLAGGLNAKNLVEAIRVTGANTLDVSSGVEDQWGRKNPDKIKEFIELASRV